MSSTINDVRVAPGESAEAKRERRLQRRRERERAHRASETAEQREERLSRRRIRDRARRAAQSVEQRQTLLQLRRERLNDESGEERDVRLEQMRERSPHPTHSLRLAFGISLVIFTCQHRSDLNRSRRPGGGSLTPGGSLTGA